MKAREGQAAGYGPCSGYFKARSLTGAGLAFVYGEFASTPDFPARRRERRGLLCSGANHDEGRVPATVQSEEGIVDIAGLIRI